MNFKIFQADLLKAWAYLNGRKGAARSLCLLRILCCTSFRFMVRFNKTGRINRVSEKFSAYPATQGAPHLAPSLGRTDHA